MLIAPTQLGGSVTYVMVDGNSMETRFHLGDLVLVRTEAAYGVGDAVVYKNAEMGRYVFHRIVQIDADHFVLKGDNNSWLDSYHPVRDEILGKLWVHIPKLGKAIEWVRLPINMALMVVLLGGVFMSGTFIKPTANGKEKKKSSNSRGGILEGGLYVFTFLALAFLGLGIFAFTRPLTRTADTISYQQQSYFFYSATGTPGVYDTELVRPGEPVFPKLTCFMNVGFTYNIAGDQLQNPSGMHQMYARVLDEQSGWQRTIPMNQQTAFAGNSYYAMSTLDLCQVESLVNVVEQETGLHPNTYTLEITTHVDLIGNVAGQPIADTFDPKLVFKFDKAHFYLAVDDLQTDPLRSTKQGFATNPDIQANTFSPFGFEFTVQSVRVISLLGFAFSLIGLMITGIYLYNSTQKSQDALIRLKYGAMLVDVYEQSLEPTTKLIDVTSIDDLARLAERHATMILHMTRNSLHYYLVQINGATYRYVINSGQEDIIAPKPVDKFEIPVSLEKNNNLTSNKAAEKNHFLPVSKEESPNAAPNQPQIEEALPIEEIDFASSESIPAWDEIQINSSNHKKNNTEIKVVENKSIPQDEPLYVIRTGNIGFSMDEPTDKVMIRKIKL